jgi:ribonuclease P protein component
MSKKSEMSPRLSRLLRHADFERVYKEGRRHFSASMTVFYSPHPERTEAVQRVGVPAPQGLRVGFTVGRALGGAVERNRMKRRLREAVRLSNPVVSVAADVVINPKKGLLKAEFSAITNEVNRAFAMIEQKLSPNAARKSGSDSSTKATVRHKNPQTESLS